MRGQGYQLFRVDLTTGPDGSFEALVGHFKRLRRAFENKFPRYRFDYFNVKTYEGNGVLHMVWAIKSERAAWIAQSWLSDEWKKIHGSPVVWVRRMTMEGHHFKRVGRYLVQQYLAGQSAIARISWSWWRGSLRIGKGWRSFQWLCRHVANRLLWKAESQGGDWVSYGEKIAGWTVLLLTGKWKWGKFKFFLSKGTVAAEVDEDMRAEDYSTWVEKYRYDAWKAKNRRGLRAYLKGCA